MIRTGPGLPTNAQPKVTAIPALAWLTSRAFTAARWPSWFRVVWAVTALVVHLPSVAAAVLTGRAVANQDRTALVAVTASRRDAIPLVVITLAMFGVGAGVADWAAVEAVALARPWVDVGDLKWVWIAVVALAAAPLFVELGIISVQSTVLCGPLAESYASQLRRAGETAWAVGPWAAWPPGNKAGVNLVDQLLPHVPDGVWLVAIARNEKVAGKLRARGFVSPDPGSRLYVRPPAGVIGIPPSTSRRRRRPHPPLDTDV